MNPIFLDLGFLQIYWYSVILFIAFLLGGMLSLHEAKKWNIPGSPVSIMSRKGYIKNTLTTETGEAKEYDNKSYILSNCDNFL